MSGLLETLSKSQGAFEELSELRSLLNNILEVDQQGDAPVEVTFRIGNNAISITQESVRFLLNDRWIDLADIDRLLMSYRAIDDTEDENNPPGQGGGGGYPAISVPPEFSVSGNGTAAISLSKSSQPAARVWASPPVGAGQPTFQQLAIQHLQPLIGTGANTITAGDDPRIVNAIDATSAQLIARNSIGAISPLNYESTTGDFSIQSASSTQAGALSSTDWNTFNNKCDRAGTNQSSFRFGVNGLQLATTVGSGNRQSAIEVRNSTNTASAKLVSSGYAIGDDIYIKPVQDGQSAIGCYWGMQIGGLRSFDFYALDWTAVEPSISNIESRNSSCLIVSPGATKGNDSPSSFTTLAVQKTAWQTGGLYQKWFRHDGTIDASLDINGQFFSRRVTIGTNANPQDARLNIQNTAASEIPVLIQTVSGQSVDNIRVNDSAGNPAFRITASGTINLKSGTTVRMGDDLNPANNPTLLTSRRTGWYTPGTPGASDRNAPTDLATLLTRFNALVFDLRSHGLIGT